MRASFALLSLLVALVLACTDMPTLPERPGVENPPDVLSVATIPPREDGRTPSIVRLAIELGHPFPADAARAGRIVIVQGGADPAEVAAIVHYHTTSALRARFAGILAWGEPAEAPTRFLVQPTAPLPPGRATLVMLIDKKPPLVQELDVVDDAPRARRVWPLSGTRSNAIDAWTYCADDDATLDAALVDAPERVVLAPVNVSAHVVRRSETPCIDLAPDAPLPPGLVPPPPAIGALSPWPEPIEIGVAVDGAIDQRCAEGELSLGLACARIDDDRVLLTGNDAAPLLLLGTIGARPIAEGLSPHARLTVRGLPAATTLELSLIVRTLSGESLHEARLRTGPPHRHLVLNEVLAHPPSGSPLQRFVELVNDGDRPASLVGVSLADGDRFLPLPARTLAPGEFVLITPTGFVDGLGGDVPPSKTIARVLVDALRLTTDLSLIDDAEHVLSRFPGSTSTRSASRGRRTPDRPDDAPDAFGFDAAGKATPGATNAIE